MKMKSMKMKTAEFSERYRALAPKAKLTFPSRLGHAVTVAARDTYVPGTEGVADPERLRQFNEMMHRIFGHQSDLLSGTRDTYPEDVFFQMLVEYAKELKISGEIGRMLDTVPIPPKRASRPKQIA